jgi:peptidoglycan hydrolase CwlO-like protein
MLLFAFMVLAKPVSADNGLLSQQEQVKQHLAAAAVAVSDLDQRIAGFERSIADTNQRIQRERLELRLLARTMYAEPESPLIAAFGAGSLAEALTRFSDLAAAGDRAAATKDALDADMGNLQSQKATMQADRQQQEQLLQQLDAQFKRLQGMIGAAAIAPVAALPAAAPVAASAIQQIILNAFASLGAAAQTWALRVAKCESGYNPLAVNRSSGASGLFQFLPSSWANTPQGKAGQSVFDANANALGAAWYYNATGRTGGPWSCK